METTFLKNFSPSSSNPGFLIEGCKKGDHKAQLQIYKLFYKPVFNICIQITSDPILAEELMHESFLLAFENIGSYAGDVSFSSFTMNFILEALKNGKNY